MTNSNNFPPIILPCGAVGNFDPSSGISYYCTTCFAVVGSVDMPGNCKELFEIQEVVDILKGHK